MSSIKIAVIGCGYWGKNLVRNFAELGALKYIFDMDQEVAMHISKQYSVSALSFSDILQSDIEGIVIAAPAILHYELAKQAILAKKHVFVEKPLALTVADAKELCELAAKQGCILMVGHLLQYHPGFVKLKQLIANGELGKLQYIYSNRLNLGKFRNEENILWSFAPHDISMILNIVNDLPEQVYATGSCYLNSAVQDVTITHLSFKNGVKAHIFVSWLHPYKEQKLVVVGDCGMAVFDDSLSWDEKLKLYPHQVNWINGLPHPAKALAINVSLGPAEPLKLECQHFIDCIKNNSCPRTDGLEGLRVLQVLDKAQRSLCGLVGLEANNYFKHDTAIVDRGSIIGDGTKIWHFSHILNNVTIGNNCIIGQNVMIGPDVMIGNNCKIQNNVSIYKGVTLEDGVFCGPSCVFTNVNNPRAEIERKNEFDLTYVEKGVTIGANATILCGVKLGAYSFIGAGAVVTKDVKPHALMVGNPAKQIGWVSHAGEVLKDDLVCPREGRSYKIKVNDDAENMLCAM